MDDMTTQSISPESLSTDDWQRIIARPGLGDTHLEGEFVPYEPVVKSFDDDASPSTEEIVASVGSLILMADSDVRLDALQDINPSLTDDHLDQIAEVTELWLDSEARERLRSIVRRHYDNRPDSSSRAILSDILVEWSASGEIPRLIDLLKKTSVPDQTLAACYALASAHDAANAAFITHSERMRCQTNFADIDQSEEEIAADLRFANAE